MWSVLLSVFPLSPNLFGSPILDSKPRDVASTTISVPLFIQDLCSNDNQWQQLLCESTYVSMLEQQVSPQDIVATHRAHHTDSTSDSIPDELALKEWVGLLSAQ